MSLPTGYKRLTHIESTGTQYIDTGFKANQNTRLKMKFTYNGGDVVFGAYNAGGAAAYALQAVSGKWYTYHGNSNATSSIAATVGQTYEVDMNKNTTYIDGALVRTATVNTFTGSYPILLSCLYNGTAGASVFTSLRIYFCQIYDNDTIIRDYIPCETDTGEVGLWDDVNSEFYGNDGTGVFIRGQYVLSYGEYDEVEYIRSTGTQYVDTGFIPNQDTRVIWKGSYTVSAAATWLFGVRQSATVSNYSFLTVSNYFRSDYGADYQKQFATSITTATIVDKNKNITTVNETATVQSTYTAFTCPFTLALFAYNSNGTIAGYSTATAESVQVYDNGALVRDYIPIVMRANGVAGLLDLTTGILYENEGTGVFEVGEIVNPLEPIDPIPFPIPLLITDRTATDVAIVKQLAAKGFDNMTADEQTQWLDGLKGAYNATDLNRVESAALYLSNALGALPTTISDYAASKGVAWDSIYNVPYDPTAYTVTTKTDWRRTDIPLPSDMVRYLANIVLLRSALNFNTVDLPPDMDNLSYTEANAIERVLLDLDGAINALQTLLIGYINNAALAWFYSGEVYSGEVDA